MKEATWAKEELWVARDKDGVRLRVSETPPDSWLDSYKTDKSQGGIEMSDFDFDKCPTCGTSWEGCPCCEIQYCPVCRESGKDVDCGEPGGIDS